MPMKTKSKLGVFPSPGRVIILPDNAPDQTPSGIYLPASKKKPARGTVVAVGERIIGDNGTLAPEFCRVDDSVVFSEYAGYPIDIGGNTYLVMHESEVFAVTERK